MKRRTFVKTLAFLPADLLASPQGRKRRNAERVPDAVCGLKVEKNLELSAEHQGRRFYFCSKADRDEFKRRPGRYIVSNSG
jgi:YHS domain-containing protein